MRWLLRGLLGLSALAALVLLAAGAVLWALASEQGTAWLLGRAQARADGAIAIGRVHGSLLRGVTLERVALRFGGDELDIDTVSLTWIVPAAFAGSLAFEEVRAGRVEYRRLPGRAETEPAAPASLDLPFAIEVRDALAQSVAVTLGAETLELGRTTAAALLEDGTLRVTNAATDSSGFAFAGSLDVTFAAALELAAAIDWSRQRGEPPLAGRLTLAGTLPTLQMHHELTAPAAAVADGTLTLADAPSAELVLQWSEVAWPGFDLVTSAGGRLELEGSVQAYRFAGAGDTLVAGVPARFDVRGTGEAAALRLETFTLETARGAVHASGEIALDTLGAALDLTATDVDPSLLLADWPGRLGGTTQLRAALTPLELVFTAIDVRGTLREQPIAATGAAAYSAPDRVRLDGVRLESGASTLELDGAFATSAAAPLAFTVDARIAALDAFVPDLRGSLDAKLTLAGSRGSPRVAGNVAGQGLELFGYSAARVSIVGEVGLAADDAVTLAIEADELARGPLEIATARASVEGTSAQHRISADAVADRWHAQARAAGGWADERWSGALETLEMDEQALGRWALVDAAAVQLGERSAVIETACLTHQSGGLWCAELALQRQPDDRLVISAQNFDLATLQPLLPPELNVAGIYQLSASFADLTGEPRGSLAVSGGATQVQAAFNERQTFSTVLEGLTIGATLAAGELEIAASVRSREGDGRVSFETRIADVRAEDSPISGRLDVFWGDLGFLSLVTPDVGEIAGTVEADLLIAGTVAEPEVQGGARWNDGRVAVPQWGLAIERIAAQADSRDGSALGFRASGWVDDDELVLTGSTTLDPRAGWPTRLALRGESVRAVQLPNVEIYVSPDLAVSAALPNVHVTGTVHIPRARIELSQLPETAVAPSPDAVVHGSEEEVAELRTLRLTSDLLVTLGDAVQYLGLNLDTMVSGQLRLRRDETRATMATGSLMLAGTYSAYGQTLQLERGQLLFNGPLDDPALDVRAVRTIEEIRAGVELAGTLRAPRTRVFSDPVMSEADALSYLLLGRPVAGTGDGEETATLQTAALAMGLQQALPVVQRIGQSLGLDEFTVQSTDTDAGALMAGKYLSPRVFIRYSYGLFNRIGGLLLRFRVNERLSIETRSGDQKSMDLLYTVEKD